MSRSPGMVIILLLMSAMSLAAAPPKILTREMIYDHAPFPFAHTSTLAEIAPDEILAASVGGPASRDPGNGIWLARRKVGKWTPPRSVAKYEVACWNPVLWKDAKSGQIVLFYKIGTAPEMWTGAIVRSNDGGETWSAPEILPAGLTGCIRSRPLQLDDGSLLCGDSVESWNSWACWVNLTRDLGKTWNRYGPITLPGQPHGIIQPAIFWTDANHKTLRMLVRGSDEVAAICTSTSTDGGRTWTPTERLPVENPNSAVDAVRMKDGRIALVHNPGKTGRGVLALSFSGDGGATWGGPFTLMKTEEGEYSYPSMIEAADGTLRITYSHLKTNIGYLVIDAGR